MPYLLARAIIDKKVGIEVFTDDAVRDPQVLQLAGRIEMRLDPSLKAGSAGARPCRVTMRLKNGQSYSLEKEHAKGSPEVPMTLEELRGKFTDCARQVLDRDTAAQALEAIERLDTLADVRPLCRVLMG